MKMIKLCVGQWVEAENGDIDGPLFRQPNGQFTLGMQFITWDMDGTTDPLSAKRGYTIVKTYDAKPPEYMDIYFWMKKFPYMSRATAKLACDTLIRAKEYVAESKALINSIEDVETREKLRREWMEL
jgi:hypothetical protein